LYQYGEGVDQDYKEAIKWYLLSANQGDSKAQKALGNIYQLFEEEEKSLFWFLKCFDKENGNNVLYSNNINEVMSKQKSRICILFEN